MAYPGDLRKIFQSEKKAFAFAWFCSNMAKISMQDGESLFAPNKPFGGQPSALWSNLLTPLLITNVMSSLSSRPYTHHTIRHTADHHPPKFQLRICFQNLQPADNTAKISIDKRKV